MNQSNKNMLDIPKLKMPPTIRKKKAIGDVLRRIYELDRKDDQLEKSKERKNPGG